MERRDTDFGETCFTLCWNRVCEGSLELHEIWPIDLEMFGLDAFAVHASCPVSHLCSAYKNLLGIASS
jgi:hypothetical protein